MKTFTRKRVISIILMQILIIIIAIPTMSMAVQPTVNLGTTSSFAVLAGTTITNTGSTTINGDAGGDVGLSPGTDFTGQASVTLSGAAHLTDAVALTAKGDLTAAYLDTAGRMPSQAIDAELGGKTLIPGVYRSNTGFQITGTLTLDAQGDPDGVFIFQTGDSTLITAANSNVSLINGARYCRTFWQVGSSATLGVDSHFVGHIFALTSITASNGATVQGQLLARNGAVTLNHNTITNGVCEAPATLHVIKHVINDNGRSAVASDFNLHVKTSGIDVTASPAAGAETPGTTYTLTAGSYIVSEDAFSGYTASYSGDSDASGNITLASGQNATVTITNDDTAIPSNDDDGDSSPVYTPLIKVVKTPSLLALTSGQGIVIYTYKVSNPGSVTLSNVSVTDDKVSSVNYVSGDGNGDKLLQINETWIYTSRTNLNVTTTNISTAKGSANNMTATDTDSATVIVTKPVILNAPTTVTISGIATPAIITTTVTGGQIPITATPWYNILFAGAAFMLIGAMGYYGIRKRHE